MRYCLVEFEGESGPTLAVMRDDMLWPLPAPPSLRLALESLGPDGLLALGERAESVAAPIDTVIRWLPPVPDPRTFRDFYAFEQHVKTCRAKRGQDVPPVWYEIPVFYYSNPTTLIGHLEPVAKPAWTGELDFELEIACVMGRDICDATADEAESAIFGYCVLNDLSARDAQRREMSCMLGPAKGKDFASAIGPFVVTADELVAKRVDRGRYELAMTVRKNGRELSSGNAASLTHDFGQMLARASEAVSVSAGDLIGSGTVGTGCILELGPENTGGWLERGDIIELEIEDLGILTTPIV